MVTMPELMDIIEAARKQADLTAEEFAVKIGITSSTHSRLKNNRQGLSYTVMSAYAKYARETKNEEMLTALASIATGVEPEQIKINLS